MYAQHDYQRIGRTAPFTIGVMGLDQIDQLLPGYDLIHLDQETLLTEFACVCQHTRCRRRSSASSSISAVEIRRSAKSGSLLQSFPETYISQGMQDYLPLFFAWAARRSHRLGTIRYSVVATSRFQNKVDTTRPRASGELPVERLPLAAHQQTANKAIGRVSLKKPPLRPNNLTAPASAFSPLLQFGSSHGAVTARRSDGPAQCSNNTTSRRSYLRWRYVMMLLHTETAMTYRRV